MLTQTVTKFLHITHTDPRLTARVRNADTYEELIQLAEGWAGITRVEEWRAAFVARNAAVLTKQMIRKNIIEPFPLPPAPVLDRCVWEQVEAMDLLPVVSQLIHRKGWSAERASMAERRYRRFFYMMAVIRDGHFTPTEEIDEVWHQHILNTRRYAADCQRIGGRFLHHHPASGEAAEYEQLNDLWLQTWISYESLFDEPFEETLGSAFLQRWPATAVVRH